MTRSDSHICNPNHYYGFHPATLKGHFQGLDFQGHSGTLFSLLVILPDDFKSPNLITTAANL